jgi:parvulin-like peptidyl-prolyl isomerase
MNPHPRTNLPEPLSGVPEQPLVELGCGHPWFTLSEVNRLVRQQGVAPVLARAWVVDELVQAIPLEPARQQQLVQAWLQQHDVNDDAQLEPWLQHQRLQRADVIILATQAERLQRFRCHRWGEEVEIHFLRRKPELDQVIYSLLRVSDQSLAEELHQCLIESEAEFADLAERHAEGPERQSRGLVGPLPLTTAHPEIAGRLRVGRPGQLWPPFPVADVWVLLRLEQQLPARLNPEMRARMMDELFEAWLEERVRLLLAGEPLPGLPPVPSATEDLPAP